ncbi:MAG TPA: hypothetical protein VHF45_07745 [Thermoleophilaceae bacterium]|nr:hypothetical protein [Thermoleophilaceae bacterium]
MGRRSTLAVLCAALAVAAVGAPAADAGSRQVTVMQDDALLLRHDSATRARTLEEMDRLGADVVKVQVYWNEIAPRGRRKPQGFDATDPAGYAWGAYDEIVQGIVARGMRPFLALGNRAPDWATPKRGRYRGTYRPSARELGLFARAAGERYSGSYQGLPRVDLWSVWNEPNLFSWLAPQRAKGGTPLSPTIYRKLYLAAHEGLRATGHADDTILLGELMPLGAGSPRKVPPLEFLREVACLDRDLRPFRGRAARIRDCRGARRIPTSGIAHHPYTPGGGVHAPGKRDEAPIAQLGRLTRTLDAIARRGRLPRRLPVWITEFGFQTNPPDPFQFAIRRVPGLMDESEWIAFRNRRVRSYSQYSIRDDPPREGGSSFLAYSSFQMGLRFHNGRKKPGVYEAFPMPALVRLLGGSRVEVFGALRPGGATRASIAARVRGGSYRSVGSAPLNSAGYFRKVFRVRRAADSKYRIEIGGRRRHKSPVAR